MKALLLATLAGGLLVTAGGDAEARAHCRPGKFYRASMGVCVGKHSHAALPFVHHAGKRKHVARAYIGKPHRHELRDRIVEPEITLPPRTIETATHEPRLFKPVDNPYGVLVRLSPAE